jgi:hypothetical protein
MRMNKFIKHVFATILLASVYLPQLAHAQDFSADPDWKVTAYAWTMALDGTLGIGPIEADIDLSFSDLLDDLNYGGAVAIRRDWGRNLIVADLNYYSLSPDPIETPLGGTISTDLDMPLLQFYYGRKTATSKGYFAWLAGVRYIELDTTLTWKPGFDILDKQTRSASPDFTDFIVGGLYSTSISDKWNLNLQGDFGVGGSDHSWNAQIFFQRELQSGNAWVFGARIMDISFEDKLPNGEMIKLDAALTGLTIGFMWD